MLSDSFNAVFFTSIMFGSLIIFSRSKTCVIYFQHYVCLRVRPSLVSAFHKNGSNNLCFNCFAEHENGCQLYLIIIAYNQTK